MDGHAYELLQLSMKWKQLYHHAVDQLCCANIRRTMLLRTCYCQLNALAQKGEVPELARLNCNASVHVIKKTTQHHVLTELASVIHCRITLIQLPLH